MILAPREASTTREPHFPSRSMVLRLAKQTLTHDQSGRGGVIEFVMSGEPELCGSKTITFIGDIKFSLTQQRRVQNPRIHVAL